MTSPIEQGRRWYVVQTHPDGEGKALANLERQGFAAYLPRYAKSWRHARKTRIVAAPLFPRYMFVAIDLGAQRWLSIRSTFGVSRLVCQGDMPLPTPSGLVEGLRSRENAEGLIQLGNPLGLRAGDKVRVVGGAFEESLGLFETIRDEDRVTILLDMLGRKVRVTIDAGLIAAA